MRLATLKCTPKNSSLAPAPRRPPKILGRADQSRWRRKSRAVLETVNTLEPRNGWPDQIDQLPRRMEKKKRCNAKKSKNHLFLVRRLLLKCWHTMGWCNNGSCHNVAVDVGVVESECPTFRYLATWRFLELFPVMGYPQIIQVSLDEIDEFSLVLTCIDTHSVGNIFGT